MKIKRIIHLGIMASAMEPVKAFFHQALGLPVSHEELYDGDIDICFLPVGDSSVELFADNPVTGKGIVKEVIVESGSEGIHHVAFEVDNLDSAMQEMEEKNVPIQEGYPMEEAHNTRVVFLEPSATNPWGFNRIGSVQPLNTWEDRKERFK